MNRKTFLLWATVIVVAYFGTRLIGLLELPLFMDEATHITRAQAVWQGTPFDLILTGKALGPYFAALFYPFAGAVWIGRLVIVLLGAVGVASVITLGNSLGNRTAGLLAGLLWVCSPYLFFFERMALVDTSVAAMAALLAASSVRLTKRATIRNAAFCGLALVLCIAAKTTGIVFAVMPGLTLVLLPSNVRLFHRFQVGVIVYSVAGLFLVTPALYIVSQAANVFGVGALSSVESASLGERLLKNPGIAWDAFRAYFSPAFLAFLLILASVTLVFRFRRGLFLLALVVGPLLALFATATNLYLRYLVIALPGLLVAAGAGAVIVIGGEIRVRTRTLFASIFGVWVMLFTFPFFWSAWRAPQTLPLPESDQFEYLTGWTTGYGLRDVAEWLNTESLTEGGPITVTALLGSCNTIRLYLNPLAATGFNCPNVWESGGLARGRERIETLVQQNGSTLVIAEESGPVYVEAIPTPYTEIRRFVRPEGQYTIRVLRVER